MKPSDVFFTTFAHAVASGIVIVIAVGSAILGYFGLLAYAIVADSGIGGPLALIGMMVLAFVASLLAAMVVLCPVTVAADLLCGRSSMWRRLSQIPMATILCLVEALAICLAVAWYRHADLPSALGSGLIVWLTLLVPLGIYWWAVQILDGMKWIAVQVWIRLRGRRGDELEQRPAG